MEEDPSEIDEVLFDAALGIDSQDSREAFFDLIRDGCPERAEKLRTLATFLPRADRFFRMAEGAITTVATEAGRELIDEQTPADDQEGTSSEPGERIGRYRLEKRIGEGGCGVVYLAEQLEPVRRKVALKVIRLGMDTERVIARFEMERQSLALMDHPNIARVLDGGATEAGRPYFVMEWVRGPRITDFCDARHLSLRQRIDLFMEVCKGIQHAHQKGIIHRDIKPSNILIDEAGDLSPKIIDFGIAKAISGASLAETNLSSGEPLLGTPAYMSPEQADRRERDIDTRSDVYSLGMLLYELLAGRTPFAPADLTAAGIQETLRILIEHDPPPPSSLVNSLTASERAEIAVRRSIEPSKLAHSLRGDLDSVIMKAIEKNRTDRYETVNALLMDLLRHIGHEPVIARPAKRAYVFRKFVLRNRIAVGATVAILLSLLLGLGSAFSYYLKERRAVEEQVRLRHLADLAHAGELKRIDEARVWQDFAHVSVLLSEDRTQEADEQLRKTPLNSIRLTPQSASVLRSLGNWNALRGRWAQAAECFQMLIKADDTNEGEALMDSLDVVAIACVLIEGGSNEDFVRFRDWSIDRFAFNGTPNDVSRLLHSILIVPMDRKTLERLAPLKPVIREPGFNKDLPRSSRERELAIWRAFGLALMEYREGNDQAALEWTHLALSFQDSRDYIAGALDPILAMASHRLGDKSTARAALDRCSARIQKAFSPELPAAYEPFGKFQGFWWDWIITRVLYREAEALIHGKTSE